MISPIIYRITSLYNVIHIKYLFSFISTGICYNFGIKEKTQLLPFSSWAGKLKDYPLYLNIQRLIGQKCYCNLKYFYKLSEIRLIKCM